MAHQVAQKQIRFLIFGAVLTMQKIVSILLFLSLWGSASQIFVVASRSFPADRIEHAHLKAIFLSKRTIYRGIKLLPINYTTDDPRRNCFESTVLRKSRATLQRYWLKAHYNGHRPPKVVKSSAAMLAYLRQVPGAIGYLEANQTLPQGIKILFVTECP